MIGADFPKIHFEMFGLDLVEPMALVTDTILGVLSVWLGILLIKIKKDHPFRTYWIWFFVSFGIGAFLGGLGHIFFQQLGIGGKIPSWLSAPAAIFCLEQGMIAAHQVPKKVSQFKLLSFWKMILVYIAFSMVLVYGPVDEKPGLPFLPIAFNTIFGVILTAGILGQSYAKKIGPEFKYFVYGVLILSPSAIIFLLKINLHPWFDKNDLSHILMMIGITYFYLGVKRSIKYLDTKDISK
jgi:hypothetical protein